MRYNSTDAMIQTLGRKHTANNEDFLAAWQNIEQLVSYDEAAALVEATVADILLKTAGHRVAYAWSGGKDSLALQYVCEKAGIFRCVFCTAQELEYPAFLQWVYQNQPQGMTVIDNRNLSLRWLASNPYMLFPSDARMNIRWMERLQYAGQREYCRQQGIEFLILGRRSQDGNYLGRTGGNIYTKSNGEVRYNPISHWSHEQVMAVIHYFMGGNLPAVFYNSADGWVKGTGLWAEREYSWQEVYAVDASVVHRAAHYIQSAKDFLIRNDYEK